MSDENKIMAEELTDEEANEVAGGAGYHIVTPRYRCAMCKTYGFTDDEMNTVVVDGGEIKVCKRCAESLMRSPVALRHTER